LLTVLETFNIAMMLWFGLVLPLPLALAGWMHCNKSAIGCVLAYVGFALAVPDLVGRAGECMPEGAVGFAVGIGVSIMVTVGMALEIWRSETTCAYANQEKQCHDPTDKATLHALIDSNFKSHRALDRLVQFSAISLTARALLLQCGPVCRDAFESILRLAEGLHFEDLAEDLRHIQNILDRARSLATFCKCGRPPRTLLNGLMNRLFDEQVLGTLRKLQEEALLQGSPLRSLAEHFGKLSDDDDPHSSTTKSGIVASGLLASGGLLEVSRLGTEVDEDVP